MAPPTGLPSLRRLQSSGIQIYATLPETSGLVAVYEKTIGFLTTMPRRARNAQFLLAVLSGYSSDGGRYFSLRLILATDPPVRELREAISEAASRESLQRPGPEFAQFFSAISEVSTEVVAHCHASFSYEEEEFDSLLHLPGQPMVTNLPFDEISGYHLLKRSDSGSVDYEVNLEKREGRFDHEVIFPRTLELDEDFVRDVLQTGAEISRQLVTRRSRRSTK